MICTQRPTIVGIAGTRFFTTFCSSATGTAPLRYAALYGASATASPVDRPKLDLY
jgi:hypothetical protein